MGKFALLIGNGLNRALDNVAWSDLMSKLRTRYSFDNDDACINLPLEFERFFFSCINKGESVTQYALKKQIGAELPRISEYALISRFTSLPVEHILTTNYDYNLELSIDGNFNRHYCSSHTRETLHSLFRFIDIGSKKVWHIHGEQNCPASICLGYEQYCSYLSRMHEYLTKPSAIYPSARPYLQYYLHRNRQAVDSWVTLPFTHDIYIFGLSLSFVEISLWWLLNYRRQFQIRHPECGVSNKLHYFYNETDKGVMREQLSMLAAMGIILHPVRHNKGDWVSFYGDICRQIAGFIQPV